MDSTPQPNPQSITPDLILEAIMLTASSPEAHYLLTDATGISIGKSASIWAALANKAPAPGSNTLPTIIS